MRCTNCGLSEGRFHVELGPDGQCNYCTYWEANEPRLTNYEKNRGLFLERLARARGSGPYDALVGFSGGKDSTYVLHALTRVHGLRVLAITFDNGFLTELARSNIRSSIELLGVPHLFYQTNWELHSSLYRAALETYGDPCVGCAIPLYFYTIKYALEQRIPLVVHGRSPYQIFRNYYAESPDVFLELHESNYHPFSAAKLAAIYRRLDAHVMRWLEEMYPEAPSQRAAIHDEFFPDVDSLDNGCVPDFVGMFQYEAYDEERIKRQMEVSLGYRRPPNDRLLGHGDCTIHDASAHIFHRIHGASALEIEVAAMVRHGVLGRQEAEGLLSANSAHEVTAPDVSLDVLLRSTKLRKETFEPLLDELTRRITEKFPCH